MVVLSKAEKLNPNLENNVVKYYNKKELSHKSRWEQNWSWLTQENGTVTTQPLEEVREEILFDKIPKTTNGWYGSYKNWSRTSEVHMGSDYVSPKATLPEELKITYYSAV